MCGIAACFKTKKYTGESQIIKMLSKIEHRGDRNYEYRVFDSAVLGTNRLAIVDRERAKQPILSNDGRYAICYNGEIYNYKEIKREIKDYKFSTNSDTETLLAGYIKWGSKKILSKINGIYAFVIYDTKTKSFFAARDPIGVKPLYYAQGKNGQLYFVSEIKEISQFSDVNEIHELKPGYYLEGSLEQKQYFKLEHERIYSDETFVINKLRKLIDDAIRIRVDTDLPIGVQVSGGVDSSALLVTAMKYHPNVTAILVGGERTQDVVYGERFCKKNKIKYIKQVEPLEHWRKHWNELMDQAIYTGESIEPNPVRNMPMNMIASRLAKKHGLKIVLLGEGVDEFFAGYPEFKENLNPGIVHNKILRFVGDLHRTQLQRVDRASMWYTVEDRVPYFDRNLIEFALKIDTRLFLKKQKNGQIQEKYVLRRTVSDRLPSYIYNRPKSAFNQGTGMGSNGPDHRAQQYIEKKYSDEEYKKDRERFAKQIEFFNISGKFETYLLKKYIDFGYDKAKFTKERVAANATKDATPEAI